MHWLLCVFFTVCCVCMLVSYELFVVCDVLCVLRLCGLNIIV